MDKSIDWFSPSNLIAGYGALLSTIILIWQLIEKRNQNLGRITVRMFPHTIALTYATHVGEWTSQLGFEITNRGKSNRFIATSPRLEVKTPNQRFFLSLLEINPLIPVTYPKELVPGEKLERAFELERILDELRKVNVRKLRGFVTDTLGRTYNSKWMKIEVLKDYSSQHGEK